jgi:hypothetical protein
MRQSCGAASSAKSPRKTNASASAKPAQSRNRKAAKKKNTPRINSIITHSGSNQVTPGENIILLGDNIGPHPGTVTVKFGKREILGELI